MRLLAVVHHRAAGILVVGRYRRRDPVDGEVVLLERQRIDLDLILLDQPAERHHIGNSGNLQEPRRDDPVLNLPQLDFVEAGGASRLVAVQFADRRGQRAERRLRAVRQFGVAQFLEHHLPGKVVIGAVGERELDDRKPVRWCATGGRSPGDAVESPLDRDRDLLLHLFRRVAGEDGNDDHLRVGDVGIRLDLELAERVDPQADQHQTKRDGDEAIGARRSAGVEQSWCVLS